eukprot:GFKZ01010998.1.p2 GENE.GFKZ01010998.1~~GFKZ01010998.1.p2  ORF type:complete len:426 (+),score=56.12 GFKZ01010998.1:2092-3369(+)
MAGPLLGTMTRQHFKRLIVFALILGPLAAIRLADGHVFHVDHTDEEIKKMDIEMLLHVENDLRQQNAVVDKRVASIHGRMSKLRVQQQELELKYKKLGSARNWEMRQRESKARDLARAKAELEAKKGQIRLLSEQAEKLREDITEVEEKMTSLHREDKRLELQYQHPSLKFIISNEAERMGPVRQQLLNKTVRNIFPHLRLGLMEVEAIHEKLEHSSSTASLFASLCAYILSIALVCVAYRCIRNIHRILTLPRLLFAIDLGFVAVWVLIETCYAVIQIDPLWVMSRDHQSLSIIIQVMFMASLISNVLLRCLLVSLQLCVSALLELFLVIVVAQHFYQSVWIPFFLDMRFSTTSWTYLAYLFVSGGLAVYRARSIGLSHIDPKGYPEEDGIEKYVERLRQKFESALQYCEDLLTTGTRGGPKQV